MARLGRRFEDYVGMLARQGKTPWTTRVTKPSRRLPVGVVAPVLLPLLLAGCNSFFNSWFDPTQVGSFTRETTLDIRTSLSIQDTPVGIPGATDPRPEDLIPSYEEYRFGPGDVINIRIFELLARNTETVSQGTVDEIGTISLPVLGQVRVAGMTRSELTQELIDVLATRGIIKEATVIVDPLVRRGMTYVVFGATPAPNLYPLARPDTRLLEALNVAGGFVETVTDIYVIRDERVGYAPGSGAAARRSDGRDHGSAARRRGGSALTFSEGITGGAGGSGAGSASARRGQAPPAEEEPLPSTQAAAETDELIEAVRSPAIPAEAPEESEPRFAEEEISPAEPAGQPRWVFVNGQWMETTSEGKIAESRPSEPAGVPARPAEEPLAEVVPQIDWDRLAGEQERRIIRVSGPALRNGDYRQNIVVRGGDTIRVMAGQVGEYYVMGQVYRAGAYSITGRQVTLKSAIASAGNLAPLAWPDRCTIYRRYGDREEMHQVNLDAIFAGKESDILIKDNDLILVGTHPAAPFLAVFRNAFRMTYGFGFVWDRNFADIESYGGKVNPANLAPAFGSRFPNLFQ